MRTRRSLAFGAQASVAGCYRRFFDRLPDTLVFGRAEFLLAADADTPGLLPVLPSVGRASGEPPGYQTVYTLRQRSSLSGVRTCTSFCHNFVTTPSTSALRTLVTTLSPTLNGFFTNPEFQPLVGSLLVDDCATARPQRKMKLDGCLFGRAMRQ